MGATVTEVELFMRGVESDAAWATARDQDRQVYVIVDIRIAHAAAIENHRMIEQRTVAVPRGLQFFQVVGKQRNMERIDLCHLGELLRIAAVVRQRMMRLGHADLGIGARAGLASELERDDAGDIALHGEHL